MKRMEENRYLPFNPGFDAYGQTMRNYLIAQNNVLADDICMCYEPALKLHFSLKNQRFLAIWFDYS